MKRRFDVDDGRACWRDAAIITAVGAIAIAQSWMRWLDPIVDIGRDLYISERIAHGATLYRDFVYEYPPLAPYVLAALTKVIGSSLASFAIIGFAIAVGTAIVIYSVVQRVAGRVAAVSAAATFAACSLAGQSTWGCNYFFPYGYAATLGMLLYLGMVAALLVRTRAAVAIAVICAIAASWTKLEYGIFAAVVLCVGVFVSRVPWWTLIVFIAGSAMAATFVPRSMVGSASLRAFYASVAGFDRWPQLLGESALAAAALVLIAMALHRGWVAVATIAAAAIGIGGYFFVAWSVLQVVLIPLAIRRRDGPLPVLLAASLCSSSRVFLHLTPVWYGFVFVVPLYALAAYVLFELMPSRAWIAAFAGAALHSLVIAHGNYAIKTHPIVTPRGTFYDVNASRAAAINELASIGLPSLVVMPEGLTINYLLEIPTPLRYYTFTPPEAADPRAEEAILRDLEEKQPEWIALVPRDMREFGSRGFGVDYDQRIIAYLRAHYSRSSAERHGWIVLLRKLELPRR